MIFVASEKDLLRPEKYRRQVGSLLLTTLAISILSLALPVMTLQVYDRILPNPGSGTLPILISGVCIAIVLEAALRLTRAYVLGWAGATYEHQMSCGAMQHYLQADLSRLGPSGIGEHLHRMNAIGKLKDFYNGYALTVVSELVFVPLFLGLTIYIAGPLAAVPAVILMIFTVVSMIQGQKLRADLESRDQTDDERYNFLIESLDGMHTLKSFALENVFARRYEKLQEASTLANYRVTVATSNAFNTGTVMSHLMVAAVITAGAIFVLYGQITTGALIATVLLSGRMMQPVQRALVLWAKYQDYMLARQKVEALFEMPQYFAVPTDKPQPPRSGTLSLENVSFCYREHKPCLLKNINLEIKQGDTILISGSHGSGKTALLDLIAGVYPPTQGNILIDGENILRYLPEQLIHHVGYIRTDGMIFRGTIRDNMTCFGMIEDKKAQEIAALLHIDHDIAKLPSGFDTFLQGNTTDSIPPGLKQRIAMVRVLAPKPRIILFDNADRALDRAGYNMVYNLLARLKSKAALVLISEDHNICSLANRFYTLEGGMLQEAENRAGSEHIRPYRELQI